MRSVPYSVFIGILANSTACVKQKFLPQPCTRRVTAIDSNPLLQAVLILMENDQKWEGSATNLLIALNSRGVSKPLPKAPNQLTRKLREVEQNLLREGISVEWSRTAANVSHIKLIKAK